MKIISNPSPNFNSGRTQKITKVIIHGTAGEFVPSINHLKDPAPKGDPTRAVSAHYVMNRTGTSVHRLVSEKNTAWHAARANPFSIGIEHTNTEQNPFRGYKKAAQLVAEICKRHKLNPKTAVKPHYLYFNTQCPAQVDWKRIRKEAYNILMGTNYKKKYAKAKGIIKVLRKRLAKVVKIAKGVKK